MTVNIYTFYKFHSICTIPFTKIKHLTRINKLIQVPLYILLINEGSLTRSTEYIVNSKAYIKKSQKEYKKLNSQTRKIRSVWIGANLYSKLIFARSLWRTIYQQNTKLIEKLSNFPIGKSFIQHKLDIHKTIHELSYGYTHIINSKLKKSIWTRKYTLYYRHQDYITIQEFFSTCIIEYLYK
uniref:Chorismate lyase n=1 Tax=Chondria sp. (in: red algae) TaxID=1982705 RepID=A0A1Z1MDD3_9FLOR|nr:hypothetical protein [Chondria sp. (in: red algae)]